MNSTFFIEALHQYGYAALWLIVFVAAAGVPVSGSIALFAAGAFASFGDFNIFILFPVALTAAVLGDNLGYLIGWRVGVPILAWLVEKRRFRFFTPENLERARAYFRKRTGWAVFITRFLIVVLGGPINFLAGVEQYSYPRFLFWDVSGQMLSVLLSLGLGYAFAASWEEAESIFGAFSLLFLILFAAIILFVFLMRRIRQDRHASQAHAEIRATDEENGTDGTNEAVEANDGSELPQLQPLNNSLKQNSGPLPIPD